MEIRITIENQNQKLELIQENVHSLDCVEELVKALKGLLIASGHEYMERYNIELYEKDNDTITTDN